MTTPHLQILQCVSTEGGWILWHKRMTLTSADIEDISTSVHIEPLVVCTWVCFLFRLHSEEWPEVKGQLEETWN